ncbi:DUF6198 domain-containing protein, partial [Dysosmobacter welbionis]
QGIHAVRQQPGRSQLFRNHRERQAEDARDDRKDKQCPLVHGAPPLLHSPLKPLVQKEKR